MRDSDIIQIYGLAKDRLNRLGYEVDATAGFTVHKKGNAPPPYTPEVFHFENAESLHAFAAGIDEKTKMVKKAKAKKKVKKKKGKKR